MDVPREGIAVWLAVLLAILTALGGGLLTPALPPSADRPAALDDPATDTLGWEMGYWHDESIDVDPSNGLNETERQRVVGRAMARVEAIRRLEFDERVSVTVLSRTEYREEVADRPGPSPARRIHQNVKFEALFFINETTDAVSIGSKDTSNRTLGYYAPGAETIVLVSPDPNRPMIDEITLAQELFHALQDQAFHAFRQPWYPGLTREDHNAIDGVIEGDGNYVDYLYHQRCEAEWTCLRPGDSGETTSPPPHFGLSVLKFAPYAEGPLFVQQRHRNGGWDAVNALYDNPTKSTEQFIHPDRYGTDEPVPVTVANRSRGGWRVLDLDTTVDYAEFGEAGIFSMLWYPSYVARSDVIVPFDIFGEPAPGSLDYDHPVSTGWAGDRLVPYINGSVGQDADTGYVWKIAWDSVADAKEFHTAYLRLLRFNGGESLGNGVWRLDDSRGFSDAIFVTRSGPNVTIVNAPTVHGLTQLRPDIVSEPSPTTARPTATDIVTDTATPPPSTVQTAGLQTTPRTGSPASATSTPASGPPTPGFRAVGAVLAVVIAIGVRRLGTG